MRCQNQHNLNSHKKSEKEKVEDQKMKELYKFFSTNDGHDYSGNNIPRNIPVEGNWHGI